MLQSDSFDNGHTVVLGGQGHGVGGREIKPGELVGGSYEIQTLLGKGGMGYVFCAEHTIIKRQYALKMLAPELLNEASKRRFEVEGRAIANLDHANIVKVYNMGMDAQNCPFYVMDLLDGIALSDYIEEKRGLELEECLDIFSQIAAGLAYAHNKGIVHRDIKPSNIILVDDGKGRKTVKIVDFGIAKMLPGANLHNQSQTATGLVCGSPWYMSPEQAMGKPVDQRSDIYSLGCTFFEAICGLPPYRGQSAVETMIMHHEAPIPSIRQTLAAKNLPFSVDLLLEKMVAKRPESRYQSMPQLIHDLERMRQGKAIGSGASDSGFQTHKDIFRAGTGPEDGSPTTELKGLDGRSYAEVESGAGEDERKLAPSGIPRGVLISFAALAIGLGGVAIWFLGHNNSSIAPFALGSGSEPQAAFETKDQAAGKQKGGVVGAKVAIAESNPPDAEELGVSPLAGRNLSVAPDPDLTRAQAAFDSCGPIKATLVQHEGRQLRLIDFPHWPIGLVGAENGTYKTAVGPIFVPVKANLYLIVGGHHASRVVLDCPTIVDKIAPDLFCSLDLNAADDHSNMSAMLGPARKTDAVAHIIKAASKWHNLQKLRLRNVSFTSELLDDINSCAAISELSLFRDNLNQQALAKEPFIKRLKSFDIAIAPGVGPLCNALQNSPNLQAVTFSDSHITVDDFALVTHCPNLHKLIMRDGAVKQFVPLIKQKTSLNEVWLTGHNLTPEEISSLTHCANIHKLVLNPGDFSEEERARCRGGEPKVSFVEDF